MIFIERIKCTKCGRFRQEHPKRNGDECDATYSYAVHDYPGCDSGCCGHRAYLCDKDGNILAEEYQYIHPYGDDQNEWVEAFCKSFWPEVPVRLDICQVSDD